MIFSTSVGEIEGFLSCYNGRPLYNEKLFMVDITHLVGGKYPDRWEIKKAVVHHKAGGYQPGLKGIQATADYCRQVRCWPGHPYHIDIPYEVPTDENGRYVIFQTNNWHQAAYHTGGHNADSIGIAFQGLFRSQYFKEGGSPSPAQKTVLKSLYDILAFAGMIPRRGIWGHCDFNKPACPGDDLNGIVKELRGNIPLAEKLVNWEMRQKALQEVNCSPGAIDGIYGYKTKAAVRKFRIQAGLDELEMTAGPWDPVTEATILNWIAEPK